MILDAASATILLAIVLGVLLKGKIDNYAHFIGLAIIFGILVLAGVELLIIPLIALTIAALLDEVGNDFIDKKKFLVSQNIWERFVGFFFDQRWLTKVVILGLVVINVFPYYFFLAMVLFDSAYLIMRWYSHARHPSHPIKKRKPAVISN